MKAFWKAVSVIGFALIIAILFAILCEAIMLAPNSFIWFWGVK